MLYDVVSSQSLPESRQPNDVYPNYWPKYDKLLLVPSGFLPKGRSFHTVPAADESKTVCLLPSTISELPVPPRSC